MLAGVADEVVLGYPMMKDFLPLHSGGEPRPASASQAGPLDLCNNLIPRPPCDAGLPRLIAPLVHIGGNLPGVGAQILNNAGFFGHKRSHMNERTPTPDQNGRLTISHAIYR